MALYVNVAPPLGASGGGNLEKRVQELESILTELIEQINYNMSHLGAENVLEAASVDARNIKTESQKIVADQIEDLIATKIVNLKGNPIITFDNTGKACFRGKLVDY